MTHKVKIYLGIAAIIVAVILLLIGSLGSSKNSSEIIEGELKTEEGVLRHPLNGTVITEDDFDFFPIAIAIDNAYTVRPQSGLKQADIIYEALVESNITRLLAIFDSEDSINEIGPVRSARNYFMDWAEEYGGLYMHVGGSPQALAIINDYNFTNVDQIGAGEIYFWRDSDLPMPHNVFTSSANWLRAGELKEVADINRQLIWNFVKPAETDQTPPDFGLDFKDSGYRVEWQYSQALDAYKRCQGEEKFLYNTGEQVTAENVIVQVVESELIDSEHRQMETKENGPVFIFNSLGRQEGQWKFIDGRTRFFDADNQVLKLVPGQTWVEIIDDVDKLTFEFKE